MPRSTHGTRVRILLLAGLALLSAMPAVAAPEKGQASLAVRVKVVDRCQITRGGEGTVTCTPGSMGRPRVTSALQPARASVPSAPRPSQSVTVHF